MTHEARSVKTYSWLKISFYALTNKSLSINTNWPINSHYYANWQITTQHYTHLFAGPTCWSPEWALGWLAGATTTTATLTAGWGPGSPPPPSRPTPRGAPAAWRGRCSSPPTPPPGRGAGASRCWCRWGDGWIFCCETEHIRIYLDIKICGNSRK